jgi:hypothetical protein
MTDKSRLKAQVVRKFKKVMAMADFNDLAEIDDYLTDWKNNLGDRKKL